MDFDDPFHCVTNSEYDDKLMAMKDKLDKYIQLATAGKFQTLPGMKFDAFRNSPYKEQKKLEHFFQFEGCMFHVKHKSCKNCHQFQLSTTMQSKNRCSQCSSHEASKYSEENLVQPVWYDDNGEVQYHVPDELSSLTVGEQLLIQLVSPYVPIHHIKNGTLGIKGHVCSFSQNVNDVAQVLPHLHVNAIKMIWNYTDSSGAVKSKAFLIRCNNVMNALHWLIKYHEDYRHAYQKGDLQIDPSRLDWMDGQDSAELPNLPVIEINNNDEDDIRNTDCGPAENQCVIPEEEENEDEESSGVLAREESPFTSDLDDAILHSLKEAQEQSGQGKTPTMDWPQQGSEPLSEYSDVKIFTSAFPWLFPGGIGDFCEAN